MKNVRLATLKKGEKGIITAIEDCAVKQRLIEMGMVPGTTFEIRSISPFGDPIAIRLKDFAISLRLKDADCIQIKKESSTRQMSA